MAESCPVCGNDVVADAPFCHSCGASVDAFVVDLDELDQPDTSVRATAAKSLGSVAVPIGVMALLGLLGFLFFLPNQDSGDVAGGPSARSASTPIPTAAPVVVTTPQPTLPAPTVVPTPVPPPSPVDVSALPDLGATHLVVGAQRSLHFFDLGTGVWTKTEVSGPIHDVRGLAEGVLFVRNGGILYAPTNGGSPVPISSTAAEHLLGTIGELVVVSFSSGGGEQLEARDITGAVAWSVEVPTSATAVGITDSGNIIVQGSERIVLMDPVTAQLTMITTGRVVGNIGELVLVESCTAELDCGISQVNVVTGERSRLRDDGGWFEVQGGNSLRFRSYATLEVIQFIVIDGVLTPIGDQPTLPGLQPSPMTVSASSQAVDIVPNQLRFFDANGNMVATIPSPLDSCCQDAALALISTR